VGDPQQLRDLARVPQNRSRDRTERERAIRVQRHKRGMRQSPVHGIGHDAKRREGQLVGGGDPGGNMGFHIGGMRPCFPMQGVFFFMASQRRIDPSDVGDRRAVERIGKPLRPDRIAVIARAVFVDDRAGD